MNWLDTFPGSVNAPGCKRPRHWRRPGSGRERRMPWASNSRSRGAQRPQRQPPFQIEVRRNSQGCHPLAEESAGWNRSARREAAEPGRGPGWTCRVPFWYVTETPMADRQARVAATSPERKSQDRTVGLPDSAAPRRSRWAQDLEGMAAIRPERGRGCRIRFIDVPPDIRRQSTGEGPLWRFRGGCSPLWHGGSPG